MTAHEIHALAGAYAVDALDDLERVRFEAHLAVCAECKELMVVNLAEGKKCARSWKISHDVGADPQFPEVTPRDAQALREWETMRKAAE